MKKTFLISLSFVLAIFFVISCSKTNPTSPEPEATNSPTATATATATQTGLFVERADIIQAQTSHGVGNANATIILRYGNAGGAYVQGATVSIGGAVLANSSAGTYTVSLSNIADGAALNLSISSLAGNATSSANAPWDAQIITPSSDGGYQSASSIMNVSWQYYVVSGTIPQKVSLLMYRYSDNQIYLDSIFTAQYQAEQVNLNAYTLPDTGIIYMRAFGLNEAAIVGANGGSTTFKMLNSENTRYVNMTP